MPTFSGVEKILNTVRKESEESEKRSANLSTELIQSTWDNYKKNINSPSTLSVLNKAKLELNGKELLINVPSQVAKDIMLQEKSLIQTIRSDSNTLDLIIKVRVNKDIFPSQEIEKPKKHYSSSEKLTVLLENNEMVSLLVNKFGLNVDND